MDEATSKSVITHIAFQERTDMTTTFELLNAVFSATIAIMMFLCFFSLTSATTANLFDQSKEIGVLRSMGFTKNRIRLLFFYEVAIMVFAACLLGIIVGSTVGYTMAL